MALGWRKTCICPNSGITASPTHEGLLGICLVSSEASWLVLPLLDASYYAEISLDGDAVTLFWGSVDGVMGQSGFAKTIMRVIERKKHLVVAHAV